MHLRIINGPFCKKSTKKQGVSYKEMAVDCLFLDQNHLAGWACIDVGTYLKTVFHALQEEFAQ